MSGLNLSSLNSSATHFYVGSTRSITPVDSHPLHVLPVDDLSRPKIKIELEPGDDPKNFSPVRKWIIVMIISTSALCVTFGSGVAPFTEDGIQKDFHISHEVSILSLSLFSEGLGLGPLLLGPLSEFYGRNNVYWASYISYWLATWPVAFAPNAAVHFFFRFWCGFAGSAFLSVAGGSVSDLFVDASIANPMAVYTLCPFIGPVVGPAISGAINQHLNWRWTYYIQLIWEFIQLLSLLLFVPETHVPTILKRKAQRLQKATGNPRYTAPVSDSEQMSILQAIVRSWMRPFQLLWSEQMILLLDLWDALVLGILYLTFQAFPIIFETGHGFNKQSTGLTFLAMALGMCLSLASQPFWNYLNARDMAHSNGERSPEALLVMGQLGGILVAIALLIMALTSSPSVTPVLPILASVPFGSGIAFIFTSTFTYLVTAYRPLAASALASNAAMRLTFAAVFPLFAKQMFDRLGNGGALGLLAGLTAIAAPLPFVFAKLGHRIRMKSRFAVR